MPTALFVAHSFPPAGGSGAIRALKFVRYLPSFGWRPVVLTVDRARIGQPDESLEAQIPGGVPVYRARSLERASAPGVSGAAQDGGALGEQPAALGALKRWLAHAYHFPDRHNTWFLDAVRLGEQAVRRHGAHLVYSSAAPFTNHSVALALHLLTRLPLVLELRDGWQRWNQAIFPDYPAWRGVIEAALERFAFSHAARVILLSEQSAAAFRAQYPHLGAERFEVVPNGFDPRDFADDGPDSSRGNGASFTIAHVGSFYYGRSCSDFLHAVGRLAAARPEFGAGVCVRLIGALDQGASGEIQALASRYGISDRLQRLPFVSHARVPGLLREADILLLVVNTTPGGGSAVPGKLYEYLAASKPILCLAPPGSEAASIVERARAGVVVPSGDRLALEAALAQLFDQWRAGKLRVRHDAGEVARYARTRLTARLASVFSSALAEKPCCANR